MWFKESVYEESRRSDEIAQFGARPRWINDMNGSVFQRSQMNRTEEGKGRI